jgi:hypothetical protein
MLTDLQTEGSSAAERMKLQTERFLERASRSPLDARRAYERLVHRLHRFGATQVKTASSPILDRATETCCPICDEHAARWREISFEAGASVSRCVRVPVPQTKRICHEPAVTAE